MKLTETGAQQLVFDPGQDLVADELVKRHPAAARAGRREHARTENRGCLAGAQRLQQCGQAFRRILAVAVNERDKVVTALERIVITEFLDSRRIPDFGD